MIGEPLERNDTYGYALAAQPDQSQGQPTTNTGSQPTEQERPVHTGSPKAPVPDGRTVCPTSAAGPAEPTRGPPRHFIPGTNVIESINARLRKVTRNRGQFPSEQAALKVLYLAVRNLEEFRSPSVGTKSSGWKKALQAVTIYFEGRIPTRGPPRSLTQTV
jgi:hypothetical protein